ncbi:MAG TPA: DUF6293 family protein [Candidatus Thermoplasmatota archaeon]|nr:DUF6293 family protein [Candidatus Thermoplasmatota archaeon]
MQRDLRVHIAGQGFEVRRIVQPALDMRADRVYLLTDPPKGKLRTYHARVLKQLEAAGIEARVRHCAVWDPNALVGEMGAIAEAERGNRLYVNLGTGPTTCAIAGSLAAMLWRFDAYYTRIDYEATDIDLEGDFPVKEVTFIPTFQLDPPGGDVLAVLELLGEKAGRPARKKEVVERLRERAFLKERSSAQADQNVADRVLKRALEWGFLDSEGEGRRRRLRLNARGEAGRKMFGHLPARAQPE